MSPAGPSTHGGHRHSAAYYVVFFIALLSTAVALGGALAHLFELPNKIGLPRDEYFVVQRIYRGWDRLGYVLLVELVSMIAVVIMSRRERFVFWPAVFAVLFLLAAQAVFWTYTFPANVATRNWTMIPDDWQVLRMRWEYSHAVGAAFQILAMSSLIIAVLARVRATVPRHTTR